MSDQNKPEFTSSIPKHLIEGETPAMQYLITELNKNTQATEYLLRRREESGVILDEIKNELKGQGSKLENQAKELVEIRLQTQRTNGSVLKHTAEIANLAQNKDDLKQIVEIKKTVFKLGSSKLFWGFALAILFFGINTGFFAGILKWLFKMFELV